jgi:prepilin-type N-terminal cleavage/methylation domain-containing protein
MIKRSSSGHTLLEMLIVVAMIAIVAALSIARLSGRDDAVRLGQTAALRIRERRAAAIQLNALTTPTLLQNYIQPPVTIDFTNLDTTRALRIDGTDTNHDGYDDTSGLQLTRFTPPASVGGTGSWSYAYQGEPVRLPAGWRVATSTANLAPIPPIPLGSLVTSISFTPEGKVSNQPATTGSINPNVESPFPAVYFTNGTDAWAVAVHVAGPEVWQWDRSSNQWRGFGNRTVTAGS